VSDGEDVSTTELLRRMARAMGRPARLLPVPVSWLKLAAALVGKQDVAQRLCGSLQVDIEKNPVPAGLEPDVVAGCGVATGGGERRTATACGLAMTAQSVYNLPKWEVF
jgi:hypothetical protein